jgi:plastocyanin
MVAAVLVFMLLPLAMASTTDAVNAATVVVNGGLSPKELTVPVGTTVTWQFADADKHRIRSQSGPVQFDSGGLAAGSSWSFTFDTLGTVVYGDDENKNLDAYAGAITVSDSVPAPTTTVPGTPTPNPGTPATPAPPATVSVRLANRAYSPASISIATGDTVVWSNADKDPHTVTERNFAFDSGTFNPGASWQRTFTAPGTYTYICDLHPSMVGSVTVSTPSPTGTLPPPPPPPPAPTAPAPAAPAPAPGTSGAGVGAAAGTSVSMFDFGFSPATLTVNAGATVTWSNTGLARHTVVADDGSFRSPDVRSSQTFTHTFPTSGTYVYICDIHPEMRGTIAVKGAGGEAPPAAAPAAAPAPVTASGDVRMADFSFAPRSLTISVGQSLTFVNTGSARHSATAKDGSFDTGLLARGGTARKTFNTPGTFNYVCTLHANMTGTILVTGANGEAPPPAKAPPVIAVASGDVKMVDFDFSPKEMTVNAGATVGFVNAGVAPHTATAKDGTWDTGMVRAGGRAEITFANPGTYSYYCTVHPNMVATLLVLGTDGAAPPPEAAAAAPPGPPTSADVKVLAESFEPADVRVAQGGTVNWTVESLSPHIIADEREAFVSDLIHKGDTYSFTFDQPGTYTYHDGLTGEMTGTVTVVADPDSLQKGVAEDGLTAAINIIDLDYDPREVTVVKGAEVAWTNIGVAPHTVTAKDSAWTSELLQNGDRFTHVFDELGTFEYLCTLHPNMVGTIVVTDSLGSAPPQQPQAAAPLVNSDGSGERSTPLVVLLVGGGLLGLAAFVIGRRTAGAAMRA